MRQEKETKDIQIRKEGVKLSLFTYDMIAIQGISPKTLRTNKWIQQEYPKVNIQDIREA